MHFRYFIVLQGYYLEKIHELNNRLRELNIMENARGIPAICHQITRAKKTLHKLNLKPATSPNAGTVHTKLK